MHLAMMLLLIAPGEVETREFRITVDGKQAGSYKMSIAKQADGSILQTSQADVSIRILLRSFVFEYRGSETWKDGKLMKLESTTNDDGKRYQVRAEPDAANLRVTVNGRTQTLPGNVWTSSHWHLPADRKQGDVSRIDTDNGRLLAGKIQFVGREQLTLAGQSVATGHFRITGAAPADLWFDGADRLVRQETMEEGHKTVLELVRIAR